MRVLLSPFNLDSTLRSTVQSSFFRAGTQGGGQRFMDPWVSMHVDSVDQETCAPVLTLTFTSHSVLTNQIIPEDLDFLIYGLKEIEPDNSELTLWNSTKCNPIPRTLPVLWDSIIEQSRPWALQTDYFGFHPGTTLMSCVALEKRLSFSVS